MDRHDDEIDRLKIEVNCAVVLEKMPPPWRLDAKESTRRSLKYRRGDGEVLIVNHEGRGWWDPLSEARGDVFALVQHLDPALNFGAVRRLLRGYAGLTPEFPKVLQTHQRPAPELPVLERWQARRLLSRGSPVWHYLAGPGPIQRCLPASVLVAASAADAVREGPYGSAWFAHRDAAGTLTGVEMRGPDYFNFSAGGDKSLFRLPGGPGFLCRATVCEGSIDALSLAAYEGLRPDTLYTATTGGIGPVTIVALRHLLQLLSCDPASVLVAATDADEQGRRYAARLEQLALEAKVRFEQPVPPDGLNDWNDVLRAQASEARRSA